MTSTIAKVSVKQVPVPVFFDLADCSIVSSHKHQHDGEQDDTQQVHIHIDKSL